MPMAPMLRTAMVRVSSHLLYYDAALTVQSLATGGNLEVFFDNMLEALECPVPAPDVINLPWPGVEAPLELRGCDKKAVALGLMHLLLVPLPQLPPYLQGKMPALVQVRVLALTGCGVSGVGCGGWGVGVVGWSVIVVGWRVMIADISYTSNGVKVVVGE